jgi:hypothetical protein
LLLWTIKNALVAITLFFSTIFSMSPDPPSEDVLSTEMIFSNYLAKLRQLPLEGEDDSFNMGRGDPQQQQVEELSPILKVQTDVAMILQPFFSPDGLVAKSLEFAATQVSELFCQHTSKKIVSAVSVRARTVYKNINARLIFSSIMWFIFNSDKYHKCIRYCSFIWWSVAHASSIK